MGIGLAIMGYYGVSGCSGACADFVFLGSTRFLSCSLRLAPVSASRQLMGTYLKASIQLCEPVEFRGGHLMCLAKRGGAALKCAQFRSILLSSAQGKAYHRAVRHRLVGLLQANAPASQAGAIPGVGIEAISLLARTFQYARQHQRKMWALTFFDLQAAFYRVIRETLVPSDSGDGPLCELLHKAGVPTPAFLRVGRATSAHHDSAQYEGQPSPHRASPGHDACHVVQD